MKRKIFICLCGVLLTVVAGGGIHANASSIDPNSSNLSSISSNINVEKMELVKNGDFSQDLMNWELTSNVPPVTEDAGVRTDDMGNKYVRLLSHNSYVVTSLSQIVPVNGSNDLTLSFDLNNNNPEIGMKNFGRLAILFYDDKGDFMSVDRQILYGGTSWTHYEFNYKVEGAKTVKLIFGHQGGFYADFDNISLIGK